MAPQLLGTVLIEASFVLLTTFLLAQPELVFGNVSTRMRSVVTGAGFISLCLTFCWSVIFGCVLTIHQINFHT